MRDGNELQRLGAYGVHVNDGAILLVRASAVTEVQGRWFLPGGGVDHGEHPEEALVREIAEETGLTAVVGRQLGVLSDVRTRRDGDKVHSVRLIYAVASVSGSLIHETAGSSDMAAFIPLDQARTLPLAHYVRKAALLAGLDLRSSP
jgi:ADP-ribose pyrophosphatase YjhB (NUDIX family)